MLLPFPLIVSYLFLLLASMGSAGNSKDNGKRKLGDTSFNPPQSSSASKRLQHSDSPQSSHHENEPQQPQASPLRQPKPFDLNFIPDESENHPEIISILSSEETISADLVGPSRGFAAMPSEDDDEVEDDVDEDEDDDIGTSIPLNQVSPLPQMGLEEMPNKKMKAAQREREKYIKQTKTIDSLNAELGVVAQNSSTAKWQTLQAYGQYILWLEKILLNNQEGIRNRRRQWIELGSLTVDKEKAQTEPESQEIQIQIQLFELYIKNAEENAEYEKYSKTMFRLDLEEISRNMEKAEMKNIYHGRKQYLKNVNGKWILLLILPKLFLKKQDINKSLAIDWAKEYAKSLRELFFKYCSKELKLALAHRPDFFEMPATNQPELIIINEIQPNKELDKKEWKSFKEDVKREIGIHKTKKKLGIWLVMDAYRRDILWLESLLLSNRQTIRVSLILSGKENLIPNFNLLIKSAETNRAYKDMSADIFKLTPDEIDNDAETKKIPHALETVGKENLERVKSYKLQNVMAKHALYAILPKLFIKKTTIRHIKIWAFEWARQYRKMLREDYLAAFQHEWKPAQDFMPDILKQKNEKSGTASTSATVGNKNRQKNKQKMHEH